MGFVHRPQPWKGPRPRTVLGLVGIVGLVVLTACAGSAHDDTSDTVRSARLRLSADGTRSDAQIREAVSRAPVPVLAPDDRTLLRPTVAVGREYASITGRHETTTIHVQGTRSSRTHPGIEPTEGTHALRGTKGFVSTNEGIRTATWVEQGVAYGVDVECASPDDTRCQDDRYLLEVVNHLTVIGGATP